jgi:O-antigen ligase
MSQIEIYARSEAATLSLQPSIIAIALDRIIFADFLAMVICAPLAYGTVEAWSMALFELNALLLAALLAARFVFDARTTWCAHRLVLPLAALLLLGVLQTVPFGQAAPQVAAPESIALAELGPPTLSLDPQATREATVKLLALAIYFMVAINALGSRERRRVMLLTLTILGFAVAVFAILQRLTWNGKIYWVRPLAPELLPFGPFINPNHFAGMIELILPFAFAYLLFARIKAEQRVLWLFAVVMMAAAVTLSLSRGGLLALGAQFLAFFIIGVARGRRWKVEQSQEPLLMARGALLPTALAAVAAMALWVGYDQITARWQTISQGRGEMSVAQRLGIWHDSWRMFRDRPVWGVGLGAYPTAYPAYGRSSARRERVEQAHNDYLQLLTDGGLIGGAIGLWFLVELLIAARQGWRRLSAARSLERSLVIGGSVAVLGLLVHSLLDFNLQIAANALLFLLAIALATSHDAHASSPKACAPMP